jgi:hypothetical protein
MSNLSKWRKIIKTAGYKLSIRSHSLGSSATYTHTETGQELKFNVFTPELLKRWTPLFDLIRSEHVMIDSLRHDTGAFGLKG